MINRLIIFFNFLLNSDKIYGIIRSSSTTINEMEGRGIKVPSNVTDSIGEISSYNVYDGDNDWLIDCFLYFIHITDLLPKKKKKIEKWLIA